MRKIKAATLLQSILIVAGIITGACLSNQSLIRHEEHGYAKNNVYCSIPHKLMEIAKDSIVPEIKKVEIIKDSLSGWNLYFKTENFQFTPENASTAHKQGEGHAHLWINGSKIARLYSNWFHIAELKENENVIEVTLNANSHAIMAYNGIPVAKAVTVKNPIHQNEGVSASK